MRRFIQATVTFAFLTMFTLSAAAQDPTAPRFGIKGGLAFAKWSGKAVAGLGLSGRTGIIGGGFAVIPVNDNLGLQVEVLYTQKGAKFSGEIDDETIDEIAETFDWDWESLPEDAAIEGELNNELQAKVTYLEIPILCRFSLPTEGARPYFLGGFALGIKMGSSFNWTLSGSESGNYTVEAKDFDSYVKGMDLGAVIGAGVEFGPALVEARYTMGLSNLPDISGESADLKNRAFYLLAGFGFGG